MKATLLQMDIAMGDVEANLSAAQALIDANPGSDLYVLPEVFSTGFVAEPDESHAAAGCRSLEWMRQTASCCGGAVAGSIVFREEGSFRVRFVVAKPDGEVAVADKRHLFTMGGEAKSYVGGSERTIVEVGGVRFLALVCYDLRFPVWSRCRRTSAPGEPPAYDYDAIIYVANWPAPRIGVWETLLRARAIENQAYVLGVNRVGRTDGLVYDGHSLVFDPWGRQIAASEGDAPQAVTVELTASFAAEVRRKFPVLMDADEIKD